MSNLNLNSENKKGESGDFLKTLERGLVVIKSFQDCASLTISEAAVRSGLSRPVTRRVLLTLENLGYAHLNDGRFSLTSKILSLGYAYLSSHNIWEIAQPFLEQLSKNVKESSSLVILDHTDVVYAARVSVNKIMNYSLDVGSRLPAHATSPGLVLLAHLPEDKLDAYFEQAELEALTEKTITSETQIREELKKIRESGWALSSDQLELGLISISAPVRDIRGEVVAAVNCPTHSGRIALDQVIQEYLPFVLDTAEQISNNIEFEIIQ